MGDLASQPGHFAPETLADFVEGAGPFGGGLRVARRESDQSVLDEPRCIRDEPLDRGDALLQPGGALLQQDGALLEQGGALLVVREPGRQLGEKALKRPLRERSVENWGTVDVSNFGNRAGNWQGKLDKPDERHPADEDG
jgi:hypothetical protein